ncbi:MAG: CBS domain-containing protein [Deltaproteobacteria bacterium]|nr:CBS domain-containing protein [Deltaproteobacteria bacterium]MBW2395745.1 CBS domain-containing protein [Deltaproteobacteria bacterium]
MQVSDVMRREVVTVRPSDTLPRLEEVLSRHRITGAPVVKDGEVVGVISRSDVIRQLELERSRFEDSSWYFEAFDAEERSALQDKQVVDAIGARHSTVQVRELMTTEVLSLGPDTSLSDAARQMVEHRVHRLLVMDSGKLVGLVSSLDLLRGLAELKL